MQWRRQYIHLVTQARRQTHVNPCKGIQNQQSEKFLLVESGIPPTIAGIPESKVPLTKPGKG